MVIILAIVIGIVAFVAGFLWGYATSENRISAVAIPKIEIDFEKDDSDFDEHFKKHIDTYADHHPTLIVRQLATRLRKAWNTHN